LLRYSETDGV
jgi:thiol-disulfide isomerase/thioredoxin